jgi:outer membrane protein assembly factor BamA
MFLNYSFERARVTEISSAYTDPAILQRNPFLQDSLLIGQGGVRTISKVVPSLVHNTVDHPIFPTSGVRYTVSTDLAGLGGNTNFYKPNLEGVWWWRQRNRMSLGARANWQYIGQIRESAPLPIFEKLFLGGEYTIRGFDIRSIGPRDPFTGVVLGGNKYLLFNAEQIFMIASQVRLVAFYDAGQVRDVGQHFGWWEPATRVVYPPPPFLFDPLATVSLTDPTAPGAHVEITGKQAAFKTSTGLEVRFFMPVLNVPFRLIFAYNPQRAGVLDNNLQPQKAFQFRFAVGSTF